MALRERIREATATAHADAERAPVIRAIFDGTVTRRKYAEYLRSLLPIYEVLDPRESMPLRRAAAIRADLEELGFDVEPTAEAVRYAEHLKTLQQTPRVAHAYTRYMGDLSGGQILKGRLEKAGLPSRFCRFELPCPVAEYKRQWCDWIQTCFGRLHADEVVAEAIEAFAWNQRVFDSL